ncbi:histidine decarboxylase [Spirosoma flavus]
MMTIQDQDQLTTFIHQLAQKAKTSIGYPLATHFDYRALYPLLDYAMLNLGDPFVGSNYGINSLAIELEVIEFFAELFRAPRDSFSGYVTSGGSEGNLYGLYMARERYPQGILYYSAATHYSVAKSARVLNMTAVQIASTANGEIDYTALTSAIQQNQDRPVILLANIGTTMTEAKDDVPTIRHIFQELGVQQAYIHCDAALSGIYLPLLDKNPTFDFTGGIDSLSCSGHKFIGSPIPCGVVIVRKEHPQRVGRHISYIGAMDTTILGSRNGITPVFLWYALKQLKKEGLLTRIRECLSLAAYTEDKLQRNGIAAWRNK